MKLRHENLDIWKTGRSLTNEVYSLTKQFPSEEIFGLTSQVRRAAISIPLNIAEGSGRSSKKEFAQFIRISLGSLLEVDSCLQIAYDQSYISESKYQSISTELIKPLYFKIIKFEKSLKNAGEQLNQLEQIERSEGART